MASQTVWIVDTHNRSSALAEAIASPEIHVVSFSSTNQLAQTLAGGAVGAVIASIHENEDFETLEHLSKISLTFPEIPMVLLLPEPMHAAIDWGPRVFNLIKPVSPESILRRLSYLDEHSYPTRGILQKGYLLALLDYCLLQKKHARISIRYAQKHEIEILIQQGKLHSLYIDHELKNDKILFPFALDGAEFLLEYIESDAHAAFDAKFAISDEEYRRFRLELHPFLSLMQQFPPMFEVLQIDDARLMQVLNSLPEQVHSVIRHFDGSKDLFQVFTNINLRPLETAQRIGYLYFSDVFRKTAAADAGMFSAPPLAPEKEAPKPEKGPSSSELAAWLLDPVAAARQLEDKIRESLKSKKETRGSFRPHRKTQPGLGALLRPVVAQEPLEEDASDAGWGGVNTQMQKESRDFFRSVSKDDVIPGMAPQEIVIEVNEEGEQESASGIIDVVAPENPPADAAKNAKIILEGSQSVSGESEIAPVVEPAYPSFHDETTVPLEPQDEEDIARESLSELLSLRSGADAARNVGEKDERFRETKQLQAFLIPAEAMPEADPAAVPIQAGTAAPDEERTPSPAFDEAPNGAVTPRPEVAIDEPTPVPPLEAEVPVEKTPMHGEKVQLDETSSRQETETVPPVGEAIGEIEKKIAVLESGDVAREVLTFQKKTVQGFRWKPFAAVVVVAVIVAGAYALWGTGSQDMHVSTAPQEPPAAGQEKNARTQADVSMPVVPSMEEPPVVEPPVVPSMEEPPVVPSMEEPPVVPSMEEPPVVPSMEEPPASGQPAEIAKLREQAKKLHENYRRRGIKASLKELEKLAQENPNLPEAAAFLGDIYYNDGRIAKAYSWARKAVDIDKNQSLGWWVVGLVAYEAGRKIEYVEAFREYLRLSPDDENAQQIRQLKIRELSNP